MSVLRPLRVLGPALLALCGVIAFVVGPTESTLAGTQFALLASGGALITIAGFRNPLRDRVGWRPILGLGEVAVGVAVPLGVLGTGLDARLSTLYVVVAAVAALGLVAVVGSQILVDRT